MWNTIKGYIFTKTKDTVVSKVFDWIVFTLFYEFLRRQAMKLPFNKILENNFWFQFFTEPFFLSVYAIFFALLFYWFFLILRNRYNIKYESQNIQNQKDDISLSKNIIFNNLLSEEDLQYIIGNGFTYNVNLKEFNYYIKLYEASYADNDNFSTYTPVYIYSLPKSTKSIRIKFSNIFYKNDNQLHNLIYLSQYKIYVKSNNQKYLVDKADGEVVIPVMHHELHPLFEMCGDGKDFSKLFEFVIEIDEISQKEEDVIIQKEMKNNYGWEVYNADLKFLKIDLLSFSVN